MVQVDLPAAFMLGHILSNTAKKFLKKEPNLLTNKMLGPVNLYLSCGFAPIGMFLLIVWPSWEVLYVTDWLENVLNQPFTGLCYVLFPIGMVVLGNIGFILGHYWFRKGKDLFVYIGIAVSAVLTGLPYLIYWGVYWKIGTYAEVKSGGGYSFFAPPFIVSLAILGVFFTGTLVLIIQVLRRMSKKE